MSKNSRASVKPQSVYKDLLQQGLFCDAIIKVGDVEFPVHKIIMSDCTPYFRALFTRWSEPDKKVFSIPDLSPDMMELIIEFAYTGSVKVTESNAQELFITADYLNIEKVVQTCCDFIEKMLSPHNCIGIFQFTKNYHAPELRLKAFHFIISHFEDVAFSDEFLQLPAQEVSDIISRDDLNVRQEATVYEAVIRWITHAPQQRQGYTTALLSKVRLSIMHPEYIQNHVLSNELVKDNSECQAMVYKAIKDKDLLIPPFARPRLPSAILLAIGGWSNSDPTNIIEAFDFRANHWTNITIFSEHPRAYHGAAFLGGYVYCVGGFDRVEQLNSVRRLDLSTHTWQEVAPMYYRRCYVSVAVLNGCIYALGGYDGQTRLSTAEFYQPETNQWLRIAPMHEQRSDASCTVLNNEIYICGGFNGRECLQTAECYNPETNQWTIITPMNSRRSGIGVIAYNNHVYAVGGFDGSNRLHTAEAYNPRTNTWHNVSPMLTPRSNFGIEVVENRLLVVGGFNGFTTTHNVEYYDIETNEWSEACNMAINRSALSCCVMSGLHNMADYTIRFDSLQSEQSDSEDMESDESS